MSKDIFVSYTTPDRRIADDVVSFFENQGIDCFIAPRDVDPGMAYAANLMRAIDNARAIILIASGAINDSAHVLNEIDLAFQCLPENIKFKPLKLDNTLLTPSFQYYLSRQHWLDATDPPLERHLNAFVNDILNDA